MKSGLRILLSATLIMASAGNIALPQSPGADGTASVRRALLIGINKYKALPRLQGSINDIETMRQVLITKYDFSEKRITMLMDEAATRAGILNALEQLVKDTGPQDVVYVHYSGHGSQVADLNGDEEDGLDETLVPQDGRTAEVRDIVDDELDAIFARLRARTAVIVLDSCHSGTATRSLDIRTRSVPQDTRISLYRPADVATRAIVPMLSSHFVVMTGAASHQEALDGPVGGRYHGFFSYALSRSLSASGASASPREVFGGIERELKRIQTQFGRSSMPEPQLEAPPDLLEKSLLSTPVSGEETHAEPATRLSWVEVQPAGANAVVLVKGMLLGAGPGSTWAIYPPGETRFAPGQALAVAIVSQVRGQDVVATMSPSDGKVPAGSRAVALLPAPVQTRVPIRILEVPKDRKALIEDTLRKHISDAEIVNQDRSARFLVGVQGNTLQLYTADGLQLVGSFPMDTQQWASDLASVVSRSANASELLTLDNPSSQLTLEVRVVNKPKRVSSRAVTVVADTQPAHYHIRRPGQARTVDNSLQLEIRVNADCYVTVVDVDSHGDVNLLFPNEYQKQGFYQAGKIGAGESILIPDSLDNGNRAGFHWDYSPPQGIDTIRVFTSTDLETAKTIRDRVRALQTSAAQKPGVTTRAVAAGVGDLRHNLTAIAARGLITVYDPASPALTASVPSAMKPPDSPAPALQPSPGQMAPADRPPPAAEAPVQRPAAQPDAARPPGIPTPPDAGGATTPAAALPGADWTAASVTILVKG